MYKINPLPAKVLITTDEVINQGPTDNNVDPRLLLSSIQVAELRFIKPALGTSFYNYLRDTKNEVVDAGNKVALESATGKTLTIGQIVNASEFLSIDEKELWNDFLWKVTAECVVYVATPVNYSRYTSQGEIMNNPKSIALEGSASVSADLKDVKFKMDKLLMDRIDPLLAAMEEYICANKVKFPKYDRKCDCDVDGISFKRKSAWINVYDIPCHDSCRDDD